MIAFLGLFGVFAAVILAPVVVLGGIAHVVWLGIRSTCEAFEDGWD